ncbi:hypothetical protein AQUCO_02000551v1 [Aquilegia coerulea]|uniref:Uncharacterized protein n=1 Tax=Aquilegia coerulea TaxID=218851 RepID=A0A2G5DIX8_AQUCA|nr:hypothetical protein AQUCO_02000551v1 [Aquilegia coerulea]
MKPWTFDATCRCYRVGIQTEEDIFAWGGAVWGVFLSLVTCQSKQAAAMCYDHRLNGGDHLINGVNQLATSIFFRLTSF